MRVQRFGAHITSDSKGRAAIAVPFDPDETWGAKAYHPVGGTIHPVAGTICGRRLRGTITPDGNRWVFTINPMWMRNTGVAVGDEVIVELEPEGPQRGDARYRVAQAQQRLDAAHAELTRLEDRQAQLAGAPQAYADALAAKEQYLTHSADSRGARLLALADQRGRLTAELNDLHRARDDADAAVQALAEVQDRLGTAANWSTFDTHFDHGMVANAIKHDRIDQAAQAARAADQRLAALRTDLAELGGYEPVAPRLEVTAGFKFADIFFNNIFTDLAVGHQIRDAQDTVGRFVQQVRALQDQLRDRVSTVTGRLDAMAAKRQQLLMQ